MPPTISSAADLRAALDALAQDIDALPFAAPGRQQAERRDLRDRIAFTVREYLLPRLDDLEAPARVVVVGSTGAGKSTLVNSIAGYQVTEPGALRPTTRLPVLWCHQKYEADYAFGYLSGYGTSVDAERPMRIVAGIDPLLEGVSILDAPDFDSVEEAHHEMADQLLAVADVCIFVTSAQRYADAVPWEFLEKAQRRGIPVVHVMNRITSGTEAAVDDYRARLRERGIPVNLFVTIEEQPIDPRHAGLPAETVERIVERLRILTDPEQRRRLTIETTRAGMRDLELRVRDLLAEVRAESDALDALDEVARHAYAEQVAEIGAELERGSLIREHVIQRWQDFLGTGELMRGLAEGAGRVKDWLGRVLGGTSPIERVEGEIRGELETVVSRRAGRAAAATAAAWDLDPVGSHLLRESGYELWHEDPNTATRVAAAIDDWMAHVANLVEAQGGDKKRVAQVASSSVNAVAVAATVGVFVHTGGITGAEIGVAAGAAAVQQKLLEHFFGTAAARSLISEARQKLLEDLAAVLDRDRARFDERLAGLRPPAGSTEAIETGMTAVQERTEAFYAGIEAAQPAEPA